MNAIVGLCHFCEAHGPRPLFCTFTTDDETHTTEAAKSGVQCSGCTSLGPQTVFVSRDDDGTIYCSRESVPNADVTSFLRQAAVRSITCEVNWNKEGGVVYFSETLGHVLSLTFQLKDTWARGLKRWFSIVVLMKDRMMLLSITPFLSEHMQVIATELQGLSTKVFDAEQQVCSQRALRLKTGRNDHVQSRSLMHLSGDENVFKSLHSHFTFILKAGAHTYSEKLYTSEDLLKKLQLQSKNSIFDDSLLASTEHMTLRSLEKLLSRDVFRIMLYCTLTGVHIAVKCSKVPAQSIIKSMLSLLPTNLTNIHIREASSAEQVAPTVCCLEEHENNNFAVHWSGVLPAKCPTLMTRIESSMANDKFNDDVLQQHVKSLQMEWLGIAKTVKAAVKSSGAKSSAVAALKKVLGMGLHDDALLCYWMSTFV